MLSQRQEVRVTLISPRNIVVQPAVNNEFLKKKSKLQTGSKTETGSNSERGGKSEQEVK